MDTQNIRNKKRTITKVVTVRLLGAKNLTFTTEMPQNMWSNDIFNSSKVFEETICHTARNGTEEASL